MDEIVKYKPDLFVWLGDNVYIDTNNDTKRFESIYKKLGDNPRFQKLRKACHNLAIWDDHDYGADNANMYYPLKDTSKEQFGNFWKIPKANPFWKRQGIYRAHEYGPLKNRVQIILLDGRWKLDVKNKLKPDSYLGSEQWAWLEKVISRPAKIRLICSGVQVVRINGNGSNWEMLGHFPKERQRLFDLIDKTKASGAVFLSGDMHFAEIYRTTKTPYPLYDITASGLDTVWGNTGKNKSMTDFEKVGKSLLGKNFGSIEIDWKDKPSFQFQLRDQNAKVFNSVKVQLSGLEK